MADYPIARTVAELISELQKLAPDAVPISHEPPFTGVQVIQGDNGRVYIASMWGTNEGREYRRSVNKPAA